MYIKVTGHSKIKFFEGFPPSVQDFFLYNIYVSLNAQVSGYLDLKFHNLSRFAWNRLKIRHKGTDVKF